MYHFHTSPASILLVSLQFLFIVSLLYTALHILSISSNHEFRYMWRSLICSLNHLHSFRCAQYVMFLYTAFIYAELVSISSNHEFSQYIALIELLPESLTFV